jgi:hypothetical protein
MHCYRNSSHVDNLRMARILSSPVHSSPHRRWQLSLGTPLFYSEVIRMDAVRGRTYFHLVVLLVYKPHSHLLQKVASDLAAYRTHWRCLLQLILPGTDMVFQKHGLLTHRRR